MTGPFELMGQQLIYSTILFGVVFLTTRVLGNRAPRLQYGLWWLVLFRLLLPASLASTWSARALLDRFPSTVPMGGSIEGPNVVPSSTEGATSPAAELSPWSTVAAFFWLGGSLVCCAMLRSKRRECRDVVKRAHPVTGQGILVILRRWKNVYGVRRPVRLVASEASYPPFTLGALRPVVFLPSRLLTHADPSFVESAIAHELAHIRRWDDIRLTVQNAVRVLYFFHPVVWLSVRWMNEQRERICDQMVLGGGAVSPRDYVRSLLMVLQLGGISRPSAATFGHRKRRISMRIQRILKNDPRRTGGRALTGLIVLAAALFLLPMARPSQAILVEAPGVYPLHAVELTNPLPRGRVTSPFGERRNPLDGALERHTGIDLAAKRGTLVLAPAAGFVEIAESPYRRNNKFGTVVLLDHGEGIKTFYAHLDELSVESGQRVRRGDTLGRVGTSGVSQGPHLHFEVWKDGKPVDPSQSIDF